MSAKDKIMRDYDVEFYMQRGLSKEEAIDYILNKLTVKQLWSKMSKHNRFKALNNKIDLQWLNKSLNALKLKCKNEFLK